MLRLLWRVFAGLPAYVWSGWGAAASLLLLLTAWEDVAALYDPLILPDPLTAFAALWAQVEQGSMQPCIPWPLYCSSSTQMWWQGPLLRQLGGEVAWR